MELVANTDAKMQRILPIPGTIASASFILAMGFWLRAAIRSSDSSPATGFLGLPTRGGKLTIVNCAFWAVIAADNALRLGIQDHMNEALFVSLIVAMTLPIVLPTLFLPTFSDFDPSGLHVLLLVLNAFAWGYGMSWILSRIGRWHRYHLWGQNICPTCGYDLRASFNRCPECGTPFGDDHPSPL